MLTNVAILVHDGVAPFELGVLWEAFGIDRRDDGVPLLDAAVCGISREPVRTSGGFSLTPDHGLDRAAAADLVAVPAFDFDLPTPEPALRVIREAHERGARLLSVCSGAFVLAQSGVLDGRRATTHWRHAAELARRHPTVQVAPEVLYVEDGPVVTSAGTAAGLDACLHVWRSEYGASVASAIARRMVVPPQRDGGQAQFIDRPVVDCGAETLGPLLTWIVGHLDEDLEIPALARRATMSPRTFARRFRAETGATPAAWVSAQRVAAAERLLERTSRTVEEVAREVGFGNTAILRHHFTRVRGVAPQEYRRRFGAA